MSEALQSLNENLKCQVELYNELLTLEEHKKTALIENSIQEIESITAQEEAFIIKVNRLEKERLFWAEQIGRELGKVPEDLTLAELAGHFPALKGVSLDLDRVVGRIQVIHEVNTQLLQQAMKIVNFTVEMLTFQDKNIYTHPNRQENEGTRKLHFLDQKI